VALVTFDQAKEHLQVDHDEDDAKIEFIRQQASHIVLDYLKAEEGTYQDSSEEPVDVPGAVEAATLLVCGALYENRDGSDKESSPLSQAVKDLLHRYRDPALA
jgi:hypothetical protein